jgi:MFS family permease
MAGAFSLSGYARLVRTNRNFRRLWLAQIISEMGDWLYIVVIYALLFEITGSAKAVALAFVLQVLPQVFVSPVAGIVNDRASRKRVLIAADLVRAVLVLLMLFATRAQSVGLIYSLLFLETVMWAFFEPGRSSIVPNITSPEELITANTLSSMTWSLNLAVGSGLGGIIAAFIGRDAVFLLDSLSFLASATLVYRMQFEERHLEGARPLRVRDLADFSPLAEGVRYVARDARLVALLLVKSGLGLLSPHWVLLPIYGERVFPVHGPGIDAQRGGMLAMSALMASRGVGSLLGPYLGGVWAGQSRARLRTGILLGFLLAGFGYVMLAVAPSLWIASVAMMIVNAGGSLGWVFSTTLLQQHTDDRFRGRVFSADFAFLVSAMSLVTYSAGLFIDRGVSVREVALVTGLIALVPAAAWIYGRRLWRAGDTPPVTAS